ncbi:MAG: PQQ-binding-like beta-propeller repeat protein, partial [Acidobacteriota bacterium]
TCLSLFIFWAFFTAPVRSQNLGDYYTAGFSNARTGVNAHMGDFRPPLKLVRTIPLSGIEDPEVLMAFGDFLLVGESGSPVRYHLLDRQSGEERWEQALPGGADYLYYVPAYAHDIVFLGGSTSTGTKAVRVSTGEVLWSDEAIGDTLGRHPLISGDVVVYSGASRVVAAQVETGEVLWQIEAETAPAPLCSIGDLVFWLDAEHIVHAVHLLSGEEAWQSGVPQGIPSELETYCNLIAAGKYVFVSALRRDESTGTAAYVRALDSRTGSLLWDRKGQISSLEGLLLASNHLYEVGGGFFEGELRKYDADSGQFEWLVTEPGFSGGPATPPFGSILSLPRIAGDTVYYFNGGRKRIMARDASVGTVLWGIGTDGEWVTDLCLADGQLFVLFDDRIEIYGTSREIFFAHIADGGGQTTLLTLTNTSSVPTTGSVHFLDDDGEPLLLAVEGQEGLISTAPFTSPARSSIAIRTAGGSELQSGWARVEADQPIRGSSIFQYSGNGAYSEAGVADAPASGETSVFVSRSGNVSTAVAFAVPVNEPSRVLLRLLDEQGEELAWQDATISEGGHLAQFIEEFFPDEVGDQFQGTLTIESDVPVVVTALRTENGIQLSSYPAAPTGR